MLIPMYFLIVIWGHERRIYAAIKFLLFTQLSGLLMLIAILALYFMHHQATGVYTFQYGDLLGTPLTPVAERWIMLGFVLAFAVKLPVVPLHAWLPDAHAEAPTAGSVILASLLLKTGAYGLLRFVMPLFPNAAQEFTPIALILAVIGIVYGAVMAFAQTDLKRLVAYTSVSHLGFVLLGIFSWNTLGLQGAVMTMICHGLSTGALFILVGALQERTHTRDMDRMGGLWTAMPSASAGLRSSSPWRRWACRDWVILSASSWCCWARIKSALGSPSWPPSGFWCRRAMPFAWFSACFMERTPSAGNFRTSRRAKDSSSRP